ncbi:GEVED domain-containing protein [uncultured Sunxiuqinia sp.]|uniref:beta strand repeat-containing protein n=1 Tax=uncultured Sunxiuqinia sp. TaxID=1573825 RepID=UPI002AA6F909|nr:GEVED domain-containing protein [uncultured Sunxiuqinia sp.]
MIKISDYMTMSNKVSRLLKIITLPIVLLFSFSTTFAQSPLCSSYPANFCCEYVSSVNINGVVQAGAPDATGFSTGPGYFDYTSSSMTTLTAGNTYPVSVTVKTNSGFQEYVKIWFDFNGNGDLSDSGELVFDQVNTFNGTYTYSGNITVPSNAFNGDVYIRVVMVYANTPALCGSYGYGTTLDMKATITGGVASQSLSVAVAGTGGYTGGVASSPSGIDTDNGLNTANFAEASTVTLTATPSGAANFVNWTGDISSTNNPLTVTMDAAKSITANFGPSNTGPVANNDGPYNVNTGGTVSGNVLTNDTDADGDDLDVTTEPTLSQGSFTSFDLETGAFVYQAPTNYVGTFTFSYTATDGTATDDATATITVADTIVPVVTTKNISVQLDASGSASITTSDIDNGSTDNIGITGLSLDETSFDCSNVGANTVSLTAVDAAENSASNTATVTVEDNIDPSLTVQNITVQLDASGSASITAADLVTSASDNCTVQDTTINVNSFDCVDIGSNLVQVTLNDVNGNSTSKTATVTVEDNIDPTLTVQNLTVQLDASGQALIVPSDLVTSALDNCNIQDTTLSVSSFDCGDIGSNLVQVTLNDVNGNSTVEVSTVTILDTIAPVAMSKDTTVYLDETGNISIDPTFVDNGSSDNCSLNLSLDITDFDCSNIGENTVILTSTDASENIDTSQAIVTVFDTIAPVALCRDISVSLDASGSVTITPDMIDDASYDVCSDVTLAINSDVAVTLDCKHVGGK